MDTTYAPAPIPSVDDGVEEIKEQMEKTKERYNTQRNKRFAAGALGGALLGGGAGLLAGKSAIPATLLGSGFGAALMGSGQGNLQRKIGNRYTTLRHRYEKARPVHPKQPQDPSDTGLAPDNRDKVSGFWSKLFGGAGGSVAKSESMEAERALERELYSPMYAGESMLSFGQGASRQGNGAILSPGMAYQKTTTQRPAPQRSTAQNPATSRPKKGRRAKKRTSRRTAGRSS